MNRASAIQLTEAILTLAGGAPKLPSQVYDALVKAARGLLVAHARAALSQAKRAASKEETRMLEKTSQRLRKLAPEVRPRRHKSFLVAPFVITEADLPHGMELKEEFTSGTSSGGVPFFELKVAMLEPGAIIKKESTQAAWWAEKGAILIKFPYPPNLLSRLNNKKMPITSFDYQDMLDDFYEIVKEAVLDLDSTVKHEVTHMYQWITKKGFGLPKGGLTKREKTLKEYSGQKGLQYYLDPAEFKPQIITSVREFLRDLRKKQHLGLENTITPDTLKSFIGSPKILNIPTLSLNDRRLNTSPFFGSLKGAKPRLWKKAINDFLVELKHEGRAKPFLHLLGL